MGQWRDAEHALLQLQAEEAAVGDAQGAALRLVEVVGEHGLGAVPRPAAAPELSDVVKAPACSARGNATYSHVYGSFIVVLSSPLFGMRVRVT